MNEYAVQNLAWSIEKQLDQYDSFRKIGFKSDSNIEVIIKFSVIWKAFHIVIGNFTVKFGTIQLLKYTEYRECSQIVRDSFI